MDTRSACLLAPVSSAVAAVRWQGWQVARIALIGDSQLTDTSSRGVTKLGPRLRRRGHEVETLALGGLNTRQAVAVASDVGHVEWTVYCLGANDAAPWKRVPLKEFGMNYQTLLLRSTGARQLVLGPAPVIETGVPGVRTNSEIARYSATAADVARNCGAVFVSLLAELGPHDLADDGVHLNNHGYDTLERIVVETIEQRLHGAADTGWA